MFCDEYHLIYWKPKWTRNQCMNCTHVERSSSSIFFKDYNLEEIDLLKLDCEGAEHEIIPHLLETGLINKVRSIALEMHGREEKECSHIFSELEKIYKSVERTGAQGHLAFCQGLK